MKFADRIFRDNMDRLRARVFRRDNGRWDFDLFRRNIIGGGWKVEAGWCGTSTCRTQAEAIAWLDDLGIRHELKGLEHAVTEGWPEKEPPKPTKDAAVAIAVGQRWRQGRRRLRVTWYKPHWRADAKAAGECEVGYMWIDSTGRETGTAIVGRKHEQAAHEQRFREKFRYVDDGSPIVSPISGEPEWLTGCPHCGFDPNTCRCEEL